MVIERVNEEWIAFYRSSEGKRRRAHDIVIPEGLEIEGVVLYIADLLHERATDKHPTVEVVK